METERFLFKEIIVPLHKSQELQGKVTGKQTGIVSGSPESHSLEQVFSTQLHWPWARCHFRKTSSRNRDCFSKFPCSMKNPFHPIQLSLKDQESKHLPFISAHCARSCSRYWSILNHPTLTLPRVLLPSHFTDGGWGTEMVSHMLKITQSSYVIQWVFKPKRCGSRFVNLNHSIILPTPPKNGS